MVWALLLLLELTRPVSVRLLLRHLLIPFLEIGSSTTLLPYDVFLFCFSSLWGLVFQPDILYRHGLYRNWLLYI